MKPNLESKFVDSEELANFVNLNRLEGKSIGLCHGVFDLLHPGHFEHLTSAAKECDVLLVSITGDRFVNKGPGRPYFTQNYRSLCLASIEVVDAVIISESIDALDIINLVKPDIYFKGPDYSNPDDDITGKIEDETNAVISNGGRIKLTEGFTSSSSKLINKEFSPMGSKVQIWVEEFKSNHNFEKVKNELLRIESLKVLVIGEVIVDEYSRVGTLGKVNKDPILAFSEMNKTYFLGGAFAVARNIASWCKDVSLISYVGNNWFEYEQSASGSSNLDLHLLIENDRPTIRKHRFISESDNRKLFEYYDFNDHEISMKSKDEIESFIKQSSDIYDAVIICDYGHGLITKEIAKLLSKLSCFVALNVQQNAGNQGFNDIRKYEEVDFFTLNVNEIQWTMKSKHAKYEDSVSQLLHELNAKSAFLTLGSEGLIAFTKEDLLERVWIPSFSNKVVDKVGAGDAILAMSALLTSVSCPIEIAGLISSLVAADEISKFGHTDPISLKNLLKQVKSILA